MKKLLATIGLFLAMAGNALADDNYVVVFDASGSMNWDAPNGGKKIDLAKQALEKVLLSLPTKNTNLGLLVFSAGNLNVEKEWVYPIGPIDQARLKQAIYLPKPEGGTPLGTYLKKGADALVEWRKKQGNYGTYTLVLVTDGQCDDDDLANLQRNLPLVQVRGIGVNVIGLAMGRDAWLASHSTSYQSADDSAALASAVKKVFAEVQLNANGKVDPEFFKDLDALPDLTAKAVVASLSNTGTQNQEIGKQPPTIKVLDEKTGEVTEHNNPTAGQDVQDATQVAAAAAGGGGFPWWGWILVVLGIVVVLAIGVGILGNS
jgi:hypothetical protein